jgi:hypothetical protein
MRVMPTRPHLAFKTWSNCCPVSLSFSTTTGDLPVYTPEIKDNIKDNKAALIKTLTMK